MEALKVGLLLIIPSSTPSLAFPIQVQRSEQAAQAIQQRLLQHDTSITATICHELSIDPNSRPLVTHHQADQPPSPSVGTCFFINNGMNIGCLE